ncbi:glycoside hydrolase family 76 protein [Luteolibacter flavescens]|uniref:Glycoside hydrolase family 76 protein n=1 Tax=Luteolibacter flavescens TaxID=1859460 RepID=A0ABT3FN52_9BACT|nr:glycoside hydrolase family 76 protein [Luteolibacter flavescens]MCW1885001.1 glycoside hydrolase family 76 protein [Luteolibacter flavescens]
MITRSSFLKSLAAVALLPRVSLSQDAPGRSDLAKAFRDGMKTLDDVFWVPELANWLDRPGKDLRGHFDGSINPPWWSCANAVEAMVDYMNVTRTGIYDAQLRELHAGNVLRGSRFPKLAESLRKQGKWSADDDKKLERKMKSLDPQKIHDSEFRNEYLDDSAWWGIAWLKFHERTKDPRYLRTAVAIHKHLVDNWQKNGGVSWAEEDDKRDPNAITNSLFVVLSARLHRVTKKREFLDWAERTIAWEKEVKLYDGTGIVDRPGHKGDYWTYNQGAYVGGLEALHAATGKQVWLDEAAGIATTIIEKSGVVTEQGILYEKLSTDGWDVGMFKGICARYFGTLSRTLKRQKIHPGVSAQLDRVLAASAGAILKLPQEDGLYPLEWQQPPRAKVVNYNTQLSALIAVLAAI